MSILDVIISDDPYPFLLAFRGFVITGRFGGGKTALAAWWTYRLIKEHAAFYVVTNIPLPLQRSSRYPGLYEQKPEVCHAVYLIDEAWSYLALDSSPKALRQFLAYVRKNNQYLLMPSVMPLSRHLSSFPSAEMVFNASRAVGLPVWVYGWSVGYGRRRRTGFWWFFNPAKTFRLYDSSAKIAEWRVYDGTLWSGITEQQYFTRYEQSRSQ